jgi:hypothetical protein
MSNYDDGYYLTLHVDLRDTVLEDFIEHAESVIKNLADLGLLDFKGYREWKQVKAGAPWPDNMISPWEEGMVTAQWNYVTEDDTTDIVMSVVRRGQTSCLWACMYITQGFWPKNKRYGQGKSNFRVEANHYRRDRLNITVQESHNIKPVLGDLLLVWIKHYWRGGIDILEIDNRLEEDTQSSMLHPWEQIPDNKWEREAVRLLMQGLTNNEIAERLGEEGIEVKGKTIANELAQLRKTYRGIVPLRRQRTKGDPENRE